MQKDRKFYIAIAYLFYAVSMVDKHMTREEKLKIIVFVKKYWTSEIEDKSTQEFIYATLRELIKNKTLAQDAYNYFKEFYTLDNVLFDNTVKSQLLEACDAIASSFGKKNKSELIILNKLDFLFMEKVQK